MYTCLGVMQVKHVDVLIITIVLMKIFKIVERFIRIICFTAIKNNTFLEFIFLKITLLTSVYYIIPISSDQKLSRLSNRE